MSDLAVNRRAHFDYEILATYEAGISLFGFEVKAVKSGRINLAGAYALIRGGEACPHTTRHRRCGVGAWLINATIPPYQAANAPLTYDPTRTRRLLLHQSEIKELIGTTTEKGLTLIPLKVYTHHNLIKIQLGLGRRKKKGDKRENIKKRETKREIDRTLKRG